MKCNKSFSKNSQDKNRVPTGSSCLVDNIGKHGKITAQKSNPCYQVDGELFLAPGFLAPPNLDLQGFHTYIDEAMPPENPNLYGLHPNAEIGFLTTTAENLFRTVFEMQPRDAGASSGSSVTREDKVPRFQITKSILT